MQDTKRCGIIVSTGGLVYHRCGNRHPMMRTTLETKAERLPVYCRKCKTELILDINGLRVTRHSL